MRQNFHLLVDDGTVIEQEQANRLFHSTLLEVCPNKELVSLLFELRNRAPVSQHRRKNTHTSLVSSANEHFQLLDILQANNVAAAKELITHHVLGTGRVIGDGTETPYPDGMRSRDLDSLRGLQAGGKNEASLRK